MYIHICVCTGVYIVYVYICMVFVDLCVYKLNIVCYRVA